jgi:hypothetical protein
MQNLDHPACVIIPLAKYVMHKNQQMADHIGLGLGL